MKTVISQITRTSGSKKSDKLQRHLKISPEKALATDFKPRTNTFHSKSRVWVPSKLHALLVGSSEGLCCDL